ncbi:hypothetical protein [Streptomyces sp. cmx-4-9]|uniref:hypothetical protein n=1 Tax=Streptomyces sp. cmx-4-9 TaxID=2790941 RepID=UPI00397EFB03
MGPEREVPGRREGGDGHEAVQRPGQRPAAPPLDPELDAVRKASPGYLREPITPENLRDRQEQDARARPRPTPGDLRAAGRSEVAELRVPGPPDGPQVTLVSARPAS